MDLQCVGTYIQVPLVAIPKRHIQILPDAIQKGNHMTNVAEVQNKFIKELDEKGIEHVFQWIDGWFKELASAHVKDVATRVRGTHEAVPQELTNQLVEAALIDEFISTATGVSNYSSGQGANLMLQARTAALANAINRPQLFLEDNLRIGLTLDLVARRHRVDALWEQVKKLPEKLATTS